MVFLSLALGAILVQYVASEANTMLHLMSAHVSSVSTSTIQLALLLIPAAITSVVTLFSTHGRLKVMLNFLPAAATGALAVLLAVPLLPPGLRNAFQGQPAWRYVSNAEALVVGVGAAVSLFFLWTQRASFKQHDKRKH